MAMNGNTQSRNRDAISGFEPGFAPLSKPNATLITL